MRDGGRPSALAWLVAALTGAAAALLAVGAVQWQGDNLALLAALAALTVISEVLDFAPFGNSRVSLSVFLIMVAGIVSGLPGVAVVVSVAVAADFVAHPKPVHKALFNEGALLVAGAVYVGVFEAFSTGYEGENWPDVLGPALVGGGLNFGVNSLLVAIAIGLETRSNPYAIWSERFRWLFPHYVIVGVLAALAATAYDRWDLAGVALLLVPVAMVWFALRQYAAIVSALARPFQRA